MDILNSFLLTENIASSGQPNREQLTEIAENGYDVIINLAMPDESTSIENEGSVVTILGMSYIHIPVPFKSPTTAHLEMFSGIMNSLKEKKVWVHCKLNLRVSAFLFCYLQINRGFTPQEASTPILEKWLLEMDDVWAEFINQAPAQF